MIDFTNTVVIDRPLKDVFAYLSDLERLPEWNWAIERTEQTRPGPVQVGAIYRQIRHTPVQSVEELKITALEPDELLGVQGTLGPFPASITYTLDREGGSTRLHNHVELSTPGGLRIAAPLAARAISRSVQANLTSLKHNLEVRPLIDARDPRMDHDRMWMGR